MIWAQNPGPDENKQKRELVGRSGRWWWTELFHQAGIRREDCAIQNVIRCASMDLEDGRWIMRAPTKEERRCCSIYTKDAIAKQRARIWVVLGQIAEEELFGKSRGKNPPDVFWRDDIRIFILDHPAYFLRGAPRERLEQFREKLKMIGEEFRNPSGGRFGILDRQDYRAIFTGKDALKAAKEILGYAKRGQRIAWDVEDDVICSPIKDHPGDFYDPHRVMLCVGASPKPGLSYVFVMDHPENKASEKDKSKVKQVVRILLEHDHEKVMQHGTYDVRSAKELLDAEVKGYSFDVQYGSYFDDPTRHTYGLASLVERMLPD
ncbi:MAG: uracil-DNA glycosylase family protein, partial [bacterium]|nr:uracil-DNA glycosylase family protein [bacterium]